MKAPRTKKEIQAYVEDLERQVQQLTTQKADLEKSKSAEKVQFQKVIQGNNEKIQDAESKQAELQSQLDSLQSHRDKLQEELENWKSQCAQAEEKTSSLRGQLAAKETLAQDIETSQEATVAEIQGLRVELEKSEGLLQQLRSEVEKLTAKLDLSERNAATSLSDAAAEVQELKAALEQVRTGFEKDLSDALLARKTLESDVDDKVVTIQLLESQVEALKAEKTSVEERLQTSELEHKQIVGEYAARITDLERHALTLEKKIQNQKVEKKYSVETTEDVIHRLEEEALRLSTDLAKQAEVNLGLANKMERLQNDLVASRHNEEAARRLILNEMVGGDVDDSAYTHITVDELFRIYVSKKDIEKKGDALIERMNTITVKAVDAAADTPGAADSHVVQTEPSDESPPGNLSRIGIVQVEEERRKLKDQIRQLQIRVNDLSAELTDKAKLESDLTKLKDRFSDVAEKRRLDKEEKSKQEALAKESEDKVAKLSAHIEKLMLHLRHEAAAKAKALDAHKKTEKDLVALKGKLAAISKKTNAMENLNLELQESNKVLEDQLQLMDQKYIDLRNKLDWTRTSSQKEIKRLEDEANRLRVQMHTDMVDKEPLGSEKSQCLPKELRGSKARSGLSGGFQSATQSFKTATSKSLSPKKKGKISAESSRSPFTMPKLVATEESEGTPWSDESLRALHMRASENRF